MKRLLALLLVFLLLPWAAVCESGASLAYKAASRTGPGTQYSEELGTLNPPMDLKVISYANRAETEWYHVEFTRGGKLYRIYILKSKVKDAGAARVESEAYTEDHLLASVKAYYGPGEHYAPRPGTLAAQTEVKVFETEGEWALCEYREDWRWARGYIHVSNLAYTQAAPVETAAPVDQGGWSVLPEYTEEPAPIDQSGWSVLPEYTAEPAVPAGLPLNADALPAANAVGVFFLTAAADIYAGPGEQYEVQTFQEDLASLGILSSGVRAYGQENGWVLIRYSNGNAGEYRYGWINPQALSGAGEAFIPVLTFAYQPAALIREAWVAGDPDILMDTQISLPAGSAVTALACLNADPAWVYCEYTRLENNIPVLERAFLPADALVTR